MYYTEHLSSKFLKICKYIAKLDQKVYKWWEIYKFKKDMNVKKVYKCEKVYESKKVYKCTLKVYKCFLIV